MKHFISEYQAVCLAGRLQDFAQNNEVEWEDVCGSITDMVVEKNDGTICLDDAYNEGCGIILKVASPTH